MVTSNITTTNDMVKTEKIIRHTLCCPNCSGSIRLKPDKHANEFDTLLKLSRDEFSYANTAYLNQIKTPTCIVCGKKFQITINTENFTIEIKEL